MDEYLVKVSENEKKIEKLENTIRNSMEKLKKLKEENARLTYMSITQRYKTSGLDLIDLLERTSAGSNA